MKGLEPSVVTNQYLKAVENWKSTLEIGENLAILFFPYSDRTRRIEQFETDLARTKKLAYRRIFLRIDPILYNIEETDDLTEIIVEELLKKKVIAKKEPFEKIMHRLAAEKMQVVITLLTAETLLQPNNRFFLASLYTVLTAYNPFIVCIGCYEIDVTHPSYADLFRQYPKLLQSISYYPIYGKKDTEVFIRFMASVWNIRISEQQTMRLINACGCKWWFIKDAIRQLRTQKDWNDETDDMTYRKTMLIAALLPSERSALLKVITGRKLFDPIEQHSLNYLIKMRVVTDDNKLTIPIIKKPLLASFGSAHVLTYENNMVYLNHVPIGKFFSRKEIRALKTLVAQPGTIISREELAEAIWPMNTDMNYSNWAIDQIIARVRKRLPEFEIPPASIKSIRGKGYMYIQL